MQVVRKDPLRFIRYLALLLTEECLCSDAGHRRRFMARILWRCERTFRLYSIAKHFYMACLAVRCAVMPHGEGEKMWRHRGFLWAIYGLDNYAYLKAWLTKASEGPRIIIIGAGSIGDVLQITPVLRALRERAPQAEICLLHRCVGAHKILGNNPNVNSVSWADFYTFSEIKQAVQNGGVADLIVDIESARYLVTYMRAPQALRSATFDALFPEEFFAKAEVARALWDAMPLAVRRADGTFAWPEERKPFHYLDVLGTTGNLPVERNAALDFYINEGAAVPDNVPQNTPYVTVQSGVDRDVINWGRAVRRRATKLLPITTWREAVYLLREQGYAVVQLGAPFDEAIEGTNADLRGKTTLHEAAQIIKGAAFHVGTEGGLVHLARAVDTRSIVLFGPTAVEFFGYPQNINLTVGNCAACWLSARDWFIFCPRGFEEPPCMAGHTAASIFKAAESLSYRDERKRNI